MRIRLADYVAEFLVSHDIAECFMVTGGGAMHLDDALGHKDGLRCTYNHHEQACAIAAESYARVAGRPAAVCVTTGPGGTNAITGVVGAWLDSVPMIVISGQVRYDTTARGMGLELRAAGDQEFDICRCVSSMTKYCEMLEDPSRIRYVLEKACHLAVSGRPGPCWVDIPLNFQACTIDTDELVGYDPREEARELLELAARSGSDGGSVSVVSDSDSASVLAEASSAARTVEDAARSGELARLCAQVSASGDTVRMHETLRTYGLEECSVEAAAVAGIVEDLRRAKRPVLYSGAGVRAAGAFPVFQQLVRALNVPVVTGWDNIDMMPDADPLYVGRAGIMGDRPGNWAVQNADLVLSVGSRLSIRQVGYNWKTWAPQAKVVMVDIDAEELRKPTLHVDVAVQADAGIFMAALLEQVLQTGKPLCPDSIWHDTCRAWKRDYPVVLHRHWEDTRLTNVYAFVDALSARLPEGYVTVVGNGSACVVGSHAYHIKQGQRFVINSAIASMGYDLPAAIGACRACGDAELVCISGDGSLQMNLQELQTILTNKLPVKLFVINNEGYHSIRQTQGNIFPEHAFVGIGPQSGDLEFPQLERIASAYGYPYFACRSNTQLDAFLDDVFGTDGACMAEVFVSPEQPFEPKSATKRLEDGTLYSPPLEDLAPFLPRSELEAVMSVSR